MATTCASASHIDGKDDRNFLFKLPIIKSPRGTSEKRTYRMRRYLCFYYTRDIDMFGKEAIQLINPVGIDLTCISRN